MRFIDEAKVRVIGGDGGAGLISWRREKYEPRGGPDGGNGGDGGAVVFVTEPGLNTLIDFSFNPLLRAAPGENGGPNQREGADGENLICRVPVGTQVYFEDRLVADLCVPGARWVAARGGKGGKGNAFFKSPVNQAPEQAQPGYNGESFELTLVLKSVADVGLVGLPNVGKSTLISAITENHPKVADYPFTTLRPSLGVVMGKGERRLVMADIPGLIPGAHQGKGLGLQFLRHIERTKTLAHLIDVTTTIDGGSNLGNEALLDDEQLKRIVDEQFRAIDHELRMFSEELAERPRVVLFSKADMEASQRAYELTKEDFEKRGFRVLNVSSHSGSGLDELREALFSQVQG